MTLNYPGPYEIRQFYTVSGLEHQFRVSINLNGPVQLGQPFSTYTGNAPDNSPVTLNTWVDNLLTLVSAFYNPTDATFGRTELWVYAPNSFDASFVSSYNSAIAPAAVQATVLASQAIWTWRTTEGGIMRLSLVDGSFQGNTVLTYPTNILSYDNVFDFMLDSGGSLAVGRDTSRPFSALRVGRGQNSKLFNIRYR